MVNILHNRYNIDADWMKPALAKYIRPDMRVLVVALSFRDDRVTCAADWNRLYAPGGMYYEGIAAAFGAYGIGPERIEFIGGFADTEQSAREKVERADILYFLGGLPDRMYERLRGLNLVGIMKKYEGIVMGYSAGALIQLAEYHLSPDKDYPEFGYYEGIGWLDGFYAEVHYEGTETQNAAIRRVLRERGKTVFAMPDDGAVIVEDGRIRTLGPVRAFPAE